MSSTEEAKLGANIHNLAVTHDLKKIGDIVKALDFLRIEAKNSGHKELYEIITSAFNICFVTYNLALKSKAE